MTLGKSIPLYGDQMTDKHIHKFLSSFTFILLLNVLLLSGCAKSYEAANKELAAANPCCRNFSEFTYEKLAQDKPLIFDLDQSSPAFLFDSGKSFFKAIRLPDHTLPYKIKIRSYAEGMSIPASHIFYPEILLLKEDFNIENEIIPEFIMERDDLAAIKENTRKRGGLGIRLSGEILITSPEQRYMLIMTSDELLSSSSEWFIYLPSILVYSPLAPTEGPVTIYHSPIGRIVLEVTK